MNFKYHCPLLQTLKFLPILAHSNLVLHSIQCEKLKGAACHPPVKINADLDPASTSYELPMLSQAMT